MAGYFPDMPRISKDTSLHIHSLAVNGLPHNKFRTHAFFLKDFNNNDSFLYTGRKLTVRLQGERRHARETPIKQSPLLKGKSTLAAQA
jgi:hypothetical protein